MLTWAISSVLVSFPIASASPDAFPRSLRGGSVNTTDSLENLSYPSNESITSRSATTGQCAPEAGSCNGHFPCCRGMRCEAILGGGGRRCVKFHPAQCAPEAGSCNGHFPCCRGMRCEAILGG